MIVNNENKLYMDSFPVLIGNLLPLIYEKDGKFDYNSFYQNYLLKMFIPAEKIIIYLTPFVLGINLEIVLFDDNEKEIVKHFNYVGKSDLKISSTIFLINKKNHYELVFNYFDNKNFNLVYDLYRNDIKPKYIIEDSDLSNIYIKIKNNLKNKENLKDKENTKEKEFINNNRLDLKENKILNNNNKEQNIFFNNNINSKSNKETTKVENINKNICIICSKYIYFPNKTIKNICQGCLFNEIFIQSKKFYKDYLNNMISKINQATPNDFNNLFLNKIIINIFDKTYNIKEITEEIEFINNKIPFISNLISCLKHNICLYCHMDMNNSQFEIPCGCRFCSLNHLESFFKQLVGYKLQYNYKCICAYEYKPYQTLELCTFLKKNKIYENTDKYINHLKIIFQNFCCNCGLIKNKIFSISINNSNLLIHNLCVDCYKKNNNNTLYCILCNKIHKY